MTLDIALQRAGFDSVAGLVAGLAAGLAARPLFSNLIAGMQLAMTRSIRTGDAVIVENECGEIEEITSIYVVVRIRDPRRLIVPLTWFIEKPFQSWTRKEPGDLRRRADPCRLCRAGRTGEGQVPGDLHRLAALQVTDPIERTVELRALVGAESTGAAFDLRSEVREKLIAVLRQEPPEALPHSAPRWPAVPTQPRPALPRPRRSPAG